MVDCAHVRSAHRTVAALKRAKDLEKRIENIRALQTAYTMLTKNPGWQRMEFPGEVEDVKGVPPE